MNKCCEKCYSTYTDDDYPAHTVHDACINQTCECHTPVQQENPVNKCCGAEPKSMSSDEGTGYYVCSKCGKEFEFAVPQTSSGECCKWCKEHEFTGVGCRNQKCDCHLPLPSSSSESWVETFEKKFKENKDYTFTDSEGYYQHSSDFLSFIKNTITAEVERVIAEALVQIDDHEKLSCSNHAVQEGYRLAMKHSKEILSALTH